MAAAAKKRGGKADADAPAPVPEGLRLAWMSPQELAENPSNWRVHPPAQVAALTDSLAEVGWAGALLWNATTGRLIDGHARRKVALEQGAQRVPVLVGAWDEAQERKILATLDPIAGMAAPDPKALEALLAGVDAQGAGLQALLDDLAAGLPKLPPEPGGGGDDFDATPPDAGECRVKPGDLWLVGDGHRVLCGDSTKAEDVGRLMAGEKAAAVVTDPPYGIDRVGITNDDPAGLRPLFDAALTVLPVNNAVVVAFQSPRLFWVWLDAARAAGHHLERMLWMYKPSDCTFPWRGWLLKSEAILLTRVGDGQWVDLHPYAHDCYSPTTLGKELPEAAGHHASVKPLAVIGDLLQRVAPPEALVYDPFLGSGTTLIAAHRLGRRCYGMEVHPPYCEVALRRAEAEGLSVRKEP